MESLKKIYVQIRILVIFLSLCISCEKTGQIKPLDELDPLSEVTNFELQNIYGTKELILPNNNLMTIIFLGGRSTVDAKEVWYGHFVDETTGIDSVNLAFIIQLADIPAFVPRSRVKSEVEKELTSLSNKYPEHSFVNFYYDWGEDLTIYFSSDIDKILLVLIDSSNRLVKKFDEPYSEPVYNEIAQLISEK
jgi:hypothetical protein